MADSQPEKKNSAWISNTELAAVVLTQISDGVALFNEQGVTVGWNDGMTRITGIPESAALGRDLADLQFALAPEEHRTPERHEQIRRIIEIYARSRQAYDYLQEFENTLQRADGTRRVISSRVFPLKSGDEHLYCSLVRDITEQKAEAERYQVVQEQDRLALEMMVAERTAALTDLNARLQEDIALREQISEVLRDTQHRFHKLVDNLPGVVFRCRYDYRWTMEFLSEEFSHLFGYPVEEFLGESGRSYQELVFPEDLDRIRAEIAAGIEKEGRYTLDYRVSDRAGQMHWLTERGQAVYGADGQVIALDGVLYDRTDTHQAEENLKSSEEKFARAFMHSPIPLTISTVTGGRYLEVNEAFLRMFGFAREEVLGRTSVSLGIWVRPEIREELRVAFTQYGSLDNVEVAMRAKDGSIHYVVVSLQPITVENIDCAVSIYHDVTEERKILAALRASEARYRRLFELSPITLWEEDFTEVRAQLLGLLRSGVDDLETYLGQHPEVVRELVGKLRILDVNQAALDLYGARSKEDLIVHMREMLSSVDYLTIRSELAQIAQKPVSSYNAVVHNTRLDGTEMDLLVSWSIPSESPEELSHVIVAVKDITELKDAERRARTSLDEKETLLREIHHRVKNNLQIVSSLLGLQSEYIKDPQAKSYFRDSQNRIRSMALVHEELYRTQNLARIPMRPYLENLVTSLADAYRTGSAVEVDLRTSEISLPIDSAIPIGLIVNELVTNSLKYGFPNGEQGKITVDLRAEPDRTVLQVTDNGAGLPSDVDFTQSPSLGLHLVNILVRQLRGTIVLERWAGVSFQMTFPWIGSQETP